VRFSTQLLNAENGSNQPDILRRCLKNINIRKFPISRFLLNQLLNELFLIAETLSSVIRSPRYSECDDFVLDVLIWSGIRHCRIACVSEESTCTNDNSNISHSLALGNGECSPSHEHFA
jgi:hypothetical protein